MISIVLIGCTEPKEEIISYQEPSGSCYSMGPREINTEQNKPQEPDLTYDRYCIKDLITQEKKQFSIYCEKGLSWYENNFLLFTFDKENQKTSYQGQVNKFHIYAQADKDQVLVGRYKTSNTNFYCSNQACDNYEIKEMNQDFNIILSRKNLVLSQKSYVIKYNEFTDSYYDSRDTEEDYSACSRIEVDDLIQKVKH